MRVIIYKSGAIALSTEVMRVIGKGRIALLYNRAKSKIGIRAMTSDPNGYELYALYLSPFTNGHYEVVNAGGFLKAYGIENIRGKFEATIENGMVVFTVPPSGK